VCTDLGEIVVFQSNTGLATHYLKPLGERINCIFAAQRGLVVGGVNGYIWSFEQKSMDHPEAYTLL
jgi:hypothetical protein